MIKKLERLTQLKKAGFLLIVVIALAVGVFYSDKTHTSVASATGPCGTTTTPTAVKHVVWIWYENHSLSSVIGNSAAPYLSSMASSCGYSTNMLDNVVPSLPSEPNYLAATSGSNCVTGLESTGTGCLTGDGDVSSTNSLSTTSIFQQVKAAGGTWRGYDEAMGSNCQLTTSGLYAPKHNPAAFYTGNRTDCNSFDIPFPSITCPTTVGTCSALPSSTFLSDVRNGTLPTFSFVTPNLNNDMHNAPSTGSAVSQGDNWTKAYLPELLNGPNYKSGDTLILLMWDEGSAGGAIPNVVIAPSVPVGSKFTTTTNNVGYLHTTERLLGLSYLGCATGTKPGTSTACPTGSTADFGSTFNLAPGGTSSGGGGSDTTAPSTAITAPTSGATVSGTMTVTATASDNVGVTKVELYIDGSLQPNADTSSPYSFSVDTTKLSAGNHSLTTKAYDAAGNVGTSAAVTVNVQQPATCSATPDPNMGVVSQSVSIPASGTYRVWSRVKAPDTTNNSYYLKVDGGCPINVGDLGSMPANTWTWVDYQDGNSSSITSLSMTAGTHQLVYNGREQGLQLDRVIFTTDTTCVPTGTGDNCVGTTDTTPPTVSLTAPASGSTVSGTSVSLTASASDASGIARVDFMVDGAVVGSSTVSPYSVKWDSTTVSNGSHTISAKAVDTAGNTATTSSITVTVSNTTTSGQPDLIVTNVSWTPASPATGNQVVFSATIKNNGTVATPSGTIVGIAFQVDGQEVTWSDNVTTPLNPGESRTQTANGGSQGVAYWTAAGTTHTITAYVDDVNRIAESNESNNTLSASLTVGSTTTPGQPDLVVTNVSWTPASPATGNQVVFSATIKNNGTAATPTGTTVGIAFQVDGAEVTWSDNNSTPLNPGESRTQTANGGKLGVAYWSATSGSHTVTAWVDDVNRITESNESNNTLNATMNVSSTTTSVTGDINGDGQVNVLDLSIMLSHWQTNDSASDLNHDGTVDILDLSILLSHYS